MWIAALNAFARNDEMRKGRDDTVSNDKIRMNCH